MGTIKLKSVKDLMLECAKTCGKIDIGEIVKLAQKDAIEKTLQTASENAEADYNITESFDRITGEDIEVYVINSSITGLKDKIFKENEL